MKEKFKYFLKQIYQNLELITWVTILLLLFMPMPAEQHFTLCPFKNLGLEYCPGCGVGRSCNMALHGNFIDSLRMHPFGIFAIIVIIFRIYSLTINYFNLSKTKKL